MPLDADEGDASCSAFVLSGEGFETERANALVLLWFPNPRGDVPCVHAVEADSEDGMKTDSRRVNAGSLRPASVNLGL